MLPVAAGDQVLAALQIRVTHERVLVERGIGEHIGRAEQIRAHIDEVHAIQRPAHRIRAHVGQRIAEIVDDETRRIPHGARPEQRQHDIRAGRHAIVAERQAEIARVLRQLRDGRDVEQAADAEHRVDRDAHDVRHAVRNLQLQQIVRGDVDVADIREEVGHAVAHRLRHGPHVTLRHRLQRVLIDLVVDREHRPVVALERIALGRRRHRRATGERHRARHDDCAPHPHRLHAFLLIEPSRGGRPGRADAPIALAAPGKAGAGAGAAGARR